MALENIDPRDRREQRKFGFGLCVAFLVLGGIRWWLTGTLPMVFLALSVTFLIVSVLLPWALRPLLAGWLKVVLAINWAMTRLLLGLVFYTMIVPARLVLRIAGDDPLNRQWEPEAASYWEDPEEQPEELEAYLGQSSHNILGTMIALSVFLWNRKRFWLAPIIIVLLLLSLLMFVTGNLGIWSSFIYMGI